MTRVPTSPAPEPSTPEASAPASFLGHELHLPADSSHLPELAAFAKKTAHDARLGEKAAARLRLILEELFNNVCTHGNAGRAHTDELHKVDICCELRAQDTMLYTTFRDTAPAFDPLAGPPPGTLLLPLEDLPIGGQGLHLVRTLAQEPRYARTEEHNIFTFSLALK